VADLNRLAQAMTPESFTDFVIREFKRTKSLGGGAIAQCSAEQFFAAPAPGDNSVAVIVNDVAGNLVSRWTDLLTSDGKKPDRSRDAEFGIGPEDTRAHLQQSWERGCRILFASMGALSDVDLPRLITIRGVAHL
jgi:hypothetical protein